MAAKMVQAELKIEQVCKAVYPPGFDPEIDLSFELAVDALVIVDFGE
jgi:hypothetical protein